MPRYSKKLVLDDDQKNSIYEDTKDFISYIYEDYEFYQSLVRLFDKGITDAVIFKKVLQKNIDEIWVNKIEQ
ncbi:MAG TPA: hypothetical protein PLQ68_10385, partial [Clostridia bacterium]|nr:hypothetical protein [Clostridia bacterium]